jgi:hypothetical protein
MLILLDNAAIHQPGRASVAWRHHVHRPVMPPALVMDDRVIKSVVLVVAGRVMQAAFPSATEQHDDADLCAAPVP